MEDTLAYLWLCSLALRLRNSFNAEASLVGAALCILPASLSLANRRRDRSTACAALLSAFREVSAGAPVAMAGHKSPKVQPGRLIILSSLFVAGTLVGFSTHDCGRHIVLAAGLHFVVNGRGNIRKVKQELFQRGLRRVQACAWRERQGYWKPRGGAPEAQLQCQCLCFGTSCHVHAAGGEHGCGREEFGKEGEESTQDYQPMACPVGHSSLSQTSLQNVAKLDRSQDLRCGSQVQLSCCGRQLGRDHVFHKGNTAALNPKQHTDPRHNELSKQNTFNTLLVHMSHGKCVASLETQVTLNLRMTTT